MFALISVVAAPVTAQDYTVEYDANPADDGESFVFAQVNATEDTGVGGGARVANEYGGVNTDADAGAETLGEFTAAGVGAFASPFFVGVGAGGGSTAGNTFGGAGCGVPTLSPTDADCGASVS